MFQAFLGLTYYAGFFSKILKNINNKVNQLFPSTVPNSLGMFPAKILRCPFSPVFQQKMEKRNEDPNFDMK